MSNLPPAHPGTPLSGRSYAHSVTVFYMSGWSTTPEPRRCVFRAIGHYSNPGATGENGKHPRFTVECIEVKVLPNMEKGEMPMLLTILRRELVRLSGAEVSTIERTLVMEIGEKP